jgi:hypothetical protein
MIADLKHCLIITKFIGSCQTRFRLFLGISNHQFESKVGKSSLENGHGKRVSLS